jgi:hypothetical protein
MADEAITTFARGDVEEENDEVAVAVDARDDGKR